MDFSVIPSRLWPLDPLVCFLTCGFHPKCCPGATTRFVSSLNLWGFSSHPAILLGVLSCFIPFFRAGKLHIVFLKFHHRDHSRSHEFILISSNGLKVNDCLHQASLSAPLSVHPGPRNSVHVSADQTSECSLSSANKTWLVV